MTLRVNLVEIIVKTAAEVYINYVVIEKGGFVIYVQLLKVLYRFLRSEIMF